MVFKKKANISWNYKNKGTINQGPGFVMKELLEYHPGGSIDTKHHQLVQLLYIFRGHNFGNVMYICTISGVHHHKVA